MRTRRSPRNQEILWKALGGVRAPVKKPRLTFEQRIKKRPLQNAVDDGAPWAPTCGCQVNAPVADYLVWRCPCGEHCTDPECGRLLPREGFAQGT